MTEPLWLYVCIWIFQFIQYSYLLIFPVNASESGRGGEGEGDVKIKPTQNADNLAPDDNYSVLISYPLFLKWSIILVTESIGTAKPKPSAANTFMILTPITSPSTFTRGPPELPYIGERRSYVICQNKIGSFIFWKLKLKRGKFFIYHNPVNLAEIIKQDMLLRIS